MSPRLSEPEKFEKFDTTTYKAIVGQRLLIATGAFLALTVLWMLVDGDKETALKMLEGWLWLMAGVLGFSAGQYGVQRFSSRERYQAQAEGHRAQADSHRAETELEEVKERAKTREHVPPGTTVIEARDQSRVDVGGLDLQAPHRARGERELAGMDNSLTDDERGGHE